MKAFVRVDERDIVETLDVLEAGLGMNVLIVAIGIDQRREDVALMAGDPLTMLHIFGEFEQLGETCMKERAREGDVLVT